MLHSPYAQNGLEPLACPICRGPLTPRPGAAACMTCRLQYAVERDTYLLGPPFTSNRVATTFAGARLRQLLADAETHGFVEARRRFADDVLSGRLQAAPASRLTRLRAKVAGSTWEDMLQDLEDPARAGWKFLVNLAPDTRAVFFGASWGAVPINLARSCAQVIVLDGSVDRLQAIRHQAASVGLTNLVLARVSDPLALPLADASVDLAVIPGLREWFSAVTSVNGRVNAGGELLRIVRRALAPGGQAYVGVDNRLGPSRILAAGNGGPHYSPAAIHGAARAAGFSASQVFAPLPFRHKFHQILDLDRRDRMSFSADGYRTRGRLTRPLIRAWDVGNRDARLERRLYRYVPGFTTVLSTDTETRSFAERILDELAATGRIEPAARALRSYFVRPKGVAVLVAGVPADGGVIVRLPLDDQAARVCERHHRAIEAFASDPRLSAELRTLFPKPLASGHYDGHAFFAESARPGESGRRYYTRSGRRYDRAITSAAEVVCALRRATETRVTIDDAEFGRLCGEWLADLREIVGTETRDDLAAIDEWLRTTLIGTTVPLGWHHGDYDFANLLYGPDDRVSAILDFEAFDPRGLPLIDLLLLLARRLIRRHGLSFGMLFLRSILTRALPPLETKIFDREVAAVGADERLCRAIALCCWLNHLRLRRDSWLVRSPSWLEDNLHAVVANVRRSL
jgi:SAM-dependent methyltransferase